MTQLTELQAHAAAHAMRSSGGSFAAAIADAYFAADTGNKTKLLHAFAPLFKRHADRVEATSPPPTPLIPPTGSSHALSWQTGRSYGVFGQRMAALITPMSRILFVDLDRGIEGVSVYTTQAPLHKDMVMSCYDNGNYNNAMSEYKEDIDYLRDAAYRVPYNFGN